MAEIDVLKAQLVRDNPSTPWGFRLQGGADFGQPLTILRITPGSPAARIGLKSGDEVTEIGDVVTKNLSHDQASAVIAQYGQSLILTVERRARGSVPTHPVMNPSPTGQQARGYDMYDLTGNPNAPHHTPSYQQPHEYHRASARPFEAPQLPKPPPPPQPEQEIAYRQQQPGPPPQQYSTYTDEEEDTGLQQSRTFKILQSLMENDGEPPPPVLFARKTPGAPSATIPSQGPGNKPKVIANRQFNSPIGLYDHNVAMDTMGQKMDGVSLEAKHEKSSSDPAAPKPYVASETMKLVKKLDEEEKLYGRPAFPPPKPSKPPVGRVLDEPVPIKSSPGGTYVPNYQVSKTLSHVMKESPSEQARRFSTGTRQPPEEKERRLSGGNPPGYRKVEPPAPSPLSQSAKTDNIYHARPAIVKSSSPTPFARPVETESPTSSLLTRPLKVGNSKPVPFTRSVKSENSTPSPFTPSVKAESPTPTAYTRPSKAESPTPTAYTRPSRAESPTPVAFARPSKAESPAPYILPPKTESPTPASAQCTVDAEIPTPIVSSTIYPIKTESPTSFVTPTPYARPSNSHFDSGYQTPSSYGSPLNISTSVNTSSEAEESTSPHIYQSKSSPKTPETQTYSYTSSMVVNTSRAQIKIPSSVTSSSCTPKVHSEEKSSSPAPKSTSNSTVSHKSTSSSSSAASESYFIPASGSQNGAPVSIASAAATTSVIEAALRPKVRPYEKTSYCEEPSQMAPSEAMVMVTPRYQASEHSVKSTKQTEQQIVVDEPGFPKATITVLMPEPEPEPPVPEPEERASPWYRPSQSPSSSSLPAWSDTIHMETQPGSIEMEAKPRATITIPSNKPTSDPPRQESARSSADTVIIDERTRHTIKVPSTFHTTESKTEPFIPKGEISLNTAPRPTVNISPKFQSTPSDSTETVKEEPRHSIKLSKTSAVRKVPDSVDSCSKQFAETSSGSVTLNEAPRKTIKIPGKFQQEEQPEKEQIDIAAKSKGKFQKLTSMFQNKEAESQKPFVGRAPKRSIKIPSTFQQPEDTAIKPVRKGPIKLPTSEDSPQIGSERTDKCASNRTVISNGSTGSHPYQPVINGRVEGFRSYQPQVKTDTATIISQSYNSSDFPETPTAPDMPPPEFPPPPPPPETPPPPTPTTFLSSDLPLPPPPPADCPPTPTTPELPPPPPAIADAPPAAKREDTKAQQLYQKYADLLKEEDRGPVQSRTFNALTNMMESEPEPAAGSSGLPPPRSAYQERQRQEGQMARPGGPQGPGATQHGSPRVKVFMPQQYNTPLGMYSAQNVVETFQGQAEMQLDQLEQKHPDVISGAQRAVLESEQTRASSDF